MESPPIDHPLAGSATLRYQADNGRFVDFEPYEGERFDVEPLGFEQLVRAAESKAPNIPVVIRNARHVRASEGVLMDGRVTVTAQLQCRGPVLAYGLVEGGWLPLPWAQRRWTWLDSNVVIRLEQLKDAVEHDVAPEDPAWLAKWLGVQSGIVSPILFALEGPNRKPPGDFAMRAQLQRASSALRRVLPGARIQVIDSPQRRALHRMVLQTAEDRARATRLLMRAAPMVCEREKPHRRDALIDEIVATARQEGVRLNCLPVIALLSCVHDANPQVSDHRAATPGRAVLKPHKEYSAGDAYNALADLFFIELMCNAHALFPNDHPVLYTRDVGIAAFWSALQPLDRQVSAAPRGRVKTTISFGMDRGLFPSLSTDGVQALRGRLGLQPG